MAVFTLAVLKAAARGTLVAATAERVPGTPAACMVSGEEPGDGWHAGGVYGAGFHGPAAVNHYYGGGCWNCGASAIAAGAGNNWLYYA